MLPELDYQRILRSAEFPIFALNTDEIYFHDGLVTANEKVIDDRNQKGETLGQRRLQTPHPLYRINKLITDFTQMLDCKSTHFIDNKGFYFSYIKTQWVKVVSYKISSKVTHGSYSTISCKDINFIFAVPRFPRNAEWAQVIQLDELPWKLCSTSESYVKEKRRMI